MTEHKIAPFHADVCDTCGVVIPETYEYRHAGHKTRRTWLVEVSETERRQLDEQVARG